MHFSDLRWRTLRIISNGLPTSRRFQQPTQRCYFCHIAKGDALEHYSRCAAVLAHSRFALPLLLNTRVNKYTFFLAEHMHPAAASSITLMHDLLAWALRAIRNGSTADHREIFRARAHQLLRRRPALTGLITPF